MGKSARVQCFCRCFTDFSIDLKLIGKYRDRLYFAYIRLVDCKEHGVGLGGDRDHN